MERITESESHYNELETLPTSTLLEYINKEDASVATAVNNALGAIESLITVVADKMLAGGRLFYIGAGTSGRLAIVDASECPPTFGVPHGLVIGLIAGGDKAIRKAVEFAEDDTEQAWHDLKKKRINKNDVVVGVAASGTTPYVIGGLKKCKENGIVTGCITCNPSSPLAQASDYPIEVITGPEFITGSTRMKAGTAQKMVLNMISTCVMIKLGRVEGNKMVDMQLSNNKLIERGILMVSEALNTSRKKAENLLKEHGSVRKAILAGINGI